MFAVVGREAEALDEDDIVALVHHVGDVNAIGTGNVGEGIVCLDRQFHVECGVEETRRLSSVDLHTGEEPRVQVSGCLLDVGAGWRDVRQDVEVECDVGWVKVAHGWIAEERADT